MSALEDRIRERTALREQQRIASMSDAERAVYERNEWLKSNPQAYLNDDGSVIGLEDFREEHSPDARRAYYVKACHGLLMDMVNEPGHRNIRLNALAYRLGRLAAGLDMPYEPIAAELYKAAISTGLDKSEVRKTLRSGLEKGLANPLVLP